MEIVINVLLEMMDARSRHARMMMAAEKGHFSGFIALSIWFEVLIFYFITAKERIVTLNLVVVVKQFPRLGLFAKTS